MAECLFFRGVCYERVEQFCFAKFSSVHSLIIMSNMRNSQPAWVWHLSSGCLENKDWRPRKRKDLRPKTQNTKTHKNKTRNTAIFPYNINSCYCGLQSTVHWTKQTHAISNFRSSFRSLIQRMQSDTSKLYTLIFKSQLCQLK